MDNVNNKAKALSHRLNIPLEEAEEMLLVAEEDAKNLPQGGPGQDAVTAQRQVKEILKRLFAKGTTCICAKQLGDELKADGENVESNRHLGDLLGRGPRGLFLESQKGIDGRQKSKTFYLIPSPDEFADWYGTDGAFLPKGYYSDAFLRLMVCRESMRTNSALLSH